MTQTTKHQIANPDNKHLVQHKDGYFLISELRVAEETGNEYETSCKTYPSRQQAEKYLLQNGYTLDNIQLVLNDVMFEYGVLLGKEVLRERERRLKEKTS
jgi:hypothetical protein